MQDECMTNSCFVTVRDVFKYQNKYQSILKTVTYVTGGGDDSGNGSGNGDGDGYSNNAGDGNSNSDGDVDSNSGVNGNGNSDSGCGCGGGGGGRWMMDYTWRASLSRSCLRTMATPSTPSGAGMGSYLARRLRTLIMTRVCGNVAIEVTSVGRPCCHRGGGRGRGARTRPAAADWV
jgi:hypothetical protein